MVNLNNQEIVKQFAQHARLTSSQIEAASLLLANKELSIAFCQQYAMGDACGLSLSQWCKIKQFMHDQQVLQDLPESQVANLLQIRRFLPFDLSLKQHISLPNQLKSYSTEQLIGFVNQLISDSKLEPIELLKKQFKDADEAMLEQMRGVVFLMLAQNPDLLQSLRQTYYLHAQVELQSHSTKLSEHHKTLLNDWPKPAPLLKKLDPGLLLRFWGLRNGEHLQLKWHHPEGDQLALSLIAESLGLKNQEGPANKWLTEAIDWVWQVCLSKILYRDLLALAYDAMVEQLLPVVELKWRQLFSISPLGQKPLLVLYPHGRSGVMLLAVDGQGEVKDDSMVYPFAPDYDAEQTLVVLAKLLIKFNIEDIVLVAKPETKKLLQKTIKNLKSRYSDLKIVTHLISGDLTSVLFEKPVKQPEVEHVLHFARFSQCPLPYFASIPAKKWLSTGLQHLPNSILKEMWQDLVQNYLYTQGVDVNHANKESLMCLGLSNELIEKLIANRPYTSRQQVMDVLAIPENRFTSLVGMLRISDAKNQLDATAILPEDFDYVTSWVKTQNLKLEDVIENPELLQPKDERSRRIKSLLSLQLTKLKKLDEEHLSDLSSVKIGGHYQGVVTRVMSYGVFVDLGNGVEGLMHISSMGILHLTDLNLLFQAGDVIVVEWSQYDAQQKRLSLKLPMVKQALSTSTSPAKQVAKKPKPSSKSFQVKEEKPKMPQAPNAMQLAFAKLKK